MSMINIQTLEVGPLQVCCYLLHRQGETACILIDPGGDAKIILDHCRKEGLSIVLMLVTHSHFDHIGGLCDLHKALPQAEILCHAECSPLMQSPQNNLSSMIGTSVKAPAPTAELQDGESLVRAGISLTALHVPGHSPGHLVFYCPEAEALFSGDTLFNGSLGRTDFPGGSYDLLTSGLKEKILSLPDATRVYPGHGAHTTIGREKRHNPFIRDLAWKDS